MENNQPWIDLGTVLHEFGHALGLIHEHQNPASGGFKWNREVNSTCPPLQFN